MRYKRLREQQLLFSNNTIYNRNVGCLSRLRCRISRCYSVYTTLSHALESFPPFREPLLEIIMQILFKLYFEDLNETKIYIWQMSVLKKKSFVLFLSTFFYHFYSIELTF